MLGEKGHHMPQTCLCLAGLGPDERLHPVPRAPLCRAGCAAGRRGCGLTQTQSWKGGTVEAL